jgi:hypothetical protein
MRPKKPGDVDSESDGSGARGVVRGITYIFLGCGYCGWRRGWGLWWGHLARPNDRIGLILVLGVIAENGPANAVASFDTVCRTYVRYSPGPVKSYIPRLQALSVSMAQL